MSSDHISADERRAKLSALLQKRIKGRAGPLSPAQQRLWFLEQLDPGQPTYHIPTVLRLKGRTDVDALERSIGELICRHESLRTVYELDCNIPRQRVLPFRKFNLTIVDDFDGDPDAEGKALRLISDNISEPFDLEYGPPVRASLYYLSPLHQLFVLTVHHIAVDGWSLTLLLRELEAIYPAFVRGDPSPLPDPPLQCLDFVYWQESAFRSSALATQIAFWRAELADAPEEINLPTDFPHTYTATHKGQLHRFDIEPSVVTALRDLAHSEGATLYMALIAIYAILLHRLGGQCDLVIGSPAANRPIIEMEGMVGLCANILPIRLRVFGYMSFRELLRKTRETTLQAFQHQDVPFERIVEYLSPMRKLGRNPIFQVLFTLQNLPRNPPAKLGTKTGRLPPVVGNGRAQFDLSLSANEVDEGLVCSLEYSTDIFSEESGMRMAGQFRSLMFAATNQPISPVLSLPLNSAADRARLLKASYGPASPLPQRCPVEAISRLALTHPGDVALASHNKLLTFAELESEVAKWTEWLCVSGVGPEVRVALCAFETRDIVVGLLAVLRACGTYVPIDSHSTNNRVEFILKETNATILLTTTELLDRFDWFHGRKLLLDRPPNIPDSQSHVPLAKAHEETAAYIIFTSGSTGSPRGVVATRRGLYNHINVLQSMYPLNQEDSVLHLTNVSFDASLWELLGPLSAGASLISCPAFAKRSPSDIVEVVSQNRISAIQVVPSLLRTLLDEPRLNRCQELRRVYCGGEPLSMDLSRRFFARLDAELLNMYGPTEATIDVTSWRCVLESNLQAVPIGQPIPGAVAFLLDSNLEPVPDNVLGEIFVGGVGVARGYLNTPSETANRFVPNPFGPSGSRFYRTGDWGRRCNGSELEFGGRIDDQVKLQGNRIELGGIETILKQRSDITDAAVALSIPLRGEPVLAAMVVSRTTIKIDELRAYLLNRLPSVEVPAVIRLVKALPVMPSGKIDRQAVAESARLTVDNSFEPLHVGDETVLAGIWAKVLNVVEIGRHQNFFELGGHSLLAMQVVSRMREAFGVEVPLQQLFKTSTVASLSAWLADVRRNF
ncbi:amino acid adenylation domain-containing protein [Candidatus Nitrospira neomarina]|uniref:Amino acid adenylation domain-containing protein n=1 Tax=Candidatus Nitrospira neomarina TaxID=3020899 RepID=A0AA96JXE7_9BACT|nr:amino acid adenylation domain-containing protein [Candidatus Nitrospira neomarina]WNM63150.1 amino acid adenylation domain-containing protein [Candidatus Nitrospira neomarina]